MADARYTSQAAVAYGNWPGWICTSRRGEYVYRAMIHIFRHVSAAECKAAQHGETGEREPRTEQPGEGCTVSESCCLPRSIHCLAAAASSSSIPHYRQHGGQISDQSCSSFSLSHTDGQLKMTPVHVTSTTPKMASPVDTTIKKTRDMDNGWALSLFYRQLYVYIANKFFLLVVYSRWPVTTDAIDCPCTFFFSNIYAGCCSSKRKVNFLPLLIYGRRDDESRQMRCRPASSRHTRPKISSIRTRGSVLDETTQLKHESRKRDTPATYKVVLLYGMDRTRGLTVRLLYTAEPAEAKEGI